MAMPHRVLFWSVLFLALVLRIAGIGFGLPALFHQDEPIIVNHAVAYAGGDLNPHFFKIPPLVSYLVFGVYGVIFVVLKLFAGYDPASFARLFFADPTLFYLSARILFGALMGTFTVVILMKWASRWMSSSAAVVAGAVLAVCYLHVRDSHYIYADIPMILAITACFHYLSKSQTGGSAADYFRGCVLAGIAIAFKYIAAPVLGPVWVVGWMTAGKGRERSKRIFLGTLTALGVYAALNPYSFIDWTHFVAELRQQAAAEGVSHSLAHHIVYSLFEGMGRPAFLAGCAGLALFVRARRQAWWIGAFALGYLLMIILFSQAYERYALPIVPALCLGLAYLFDHVGRSVAETRLRRSLWALLLTACLVPTAVKSVYLVYLTAQPDTRAEALSWIEREIPQGETMVMQHIFFSPRVSQTPEQIREKSAWVGADDPHREQKLKKIEWLAGEAALRRGYRVSYLNESGWKAPVFTQASPLVEPDLSQWKRQGIRYFIRYRHPGESAFFDKTLSPYAVLVAVFSPYRESRKVMTVDVWAHVGLPFVSEELFSRDQPGPYLEIHRIIDR